MSLICENCAQDFGIENLPQEIADKWNAAIEVAIPK